MKVIIPTNFSKSAQALVDFVFKVMGPETNYVLVSSFHVNYKSSINNSIHRFTINVDQVYARKIELELARLDKKFAYQNVKIESISGEDLDSLWDFSEKENADLIVLKQSKYAFWKQKFQSQRNISIMFVPDNVVLDSFGSINYITNFSNSSKTNRLEIIRKLAKNNHSNIRLFCFNDSSDEYDIEKWNVDQELLDIEHDFEFVEDKNQISIKVMEQLESNLIQLFVLDFKKLNNDFFQGIERKIIRKTLVKPMIILPAI